MNTIKVDKLEISNDKPFVLMAGLNVLEDEKTIESVITKCIESTSKHNIPFIFKASYDKANRSSIDSYRGPGAKQGLEILRELKQDFAVPVISDIHTPLEAELASDVLDIIQIPAFLSRQTDLIEAACKTSLPLNIKKGQFLAPMDMVNVAKKVSDSGNNKILLTERGVSFGYNTLVSDMKSLHVMKEEIGFPVVFDATHSVQSPGGKGDRSGGDRKYVPTLAKAAVAVGVSSVFMETHDNPDAAPSDGPNMVKLDELEKLVSKLIQIDNLVKEN